MASTRGSGAQTPAVVMTILRLMMSDGRDPGAISLQTCNCALLSKRHSRNGSVSPIWPRMTLTLGKRLKVPPNTSRSAWVAVSTVQAQVGPLSSGRLANIAG